MDVVLDTALGPLAGTRRNGTVRFDGVPYAEAAGKGSRFAAPRPATPWREPRDARRRGPIAPQLASRLRHVMGDFAAEQGEDCLTLTITAPDPVGEGRPVVVWLHGGGYSSGAGSLDWYDGETLAREGGLVVVGVNYRLGALGYLHVPGLVEGNFGLRDQALALDWVAANIAAFGGDPDDVTCVGQSAGAHSIGCLLAGGRRPPFRRAILQSMPVTMLPQGAETAARIGRAFARARHRPRGLRRARAPARRSRARDLEAQAATARAEARSGDISPPFLPFGDGGLVPETADFVEAVAAGLAQVDFIVGTTREEMAAFYAFDDAIQALDAGELARRAGGAQAERRLARLAARRPGATPADLLGDLVTEDLFLRPSLHIAETAVRAGRTVHVYEFDWPSPRPGLKACHCIELPFMFGSLSAWGDSPMVAGLSPDELAPLSRLMRGAWIAFARTGSPNGPGLPPWPPYGPHRTTMRYDVVSGPVGDLAGLDDGPPAA